jgi:hypothetical protein
MASDEETAPPSGPSTPSRICEICEATMTHLSNLQPRLFGAALRIFRCYTCNNVISEQW